MSHLEELRELLHDMPELKGEVTPKALLREELELDSVCFVELVNWLDKKFAIEPGTYRVDSLQTVQDILDLVAKKGTHGR